MRLGDPLSPADATLFDTLVVPRYLSYFGALALQMLLPCDPAKIAHLGCRTGYLDVGVGEKLPGCTLIGVDPAPAAIELARARSALVPGVETRHLVEGRLPTSLDSGTFTHVLAVHPPVGPEGRGRLLKEMWRLLLRGGQAVFAAPLRGSFPELLDMLREHALREDDAELAAAVEASIASRPTIESLAEELEGAGFLEVDVEVHPVAIAFRDGREFAEDAVPRLTVLPEMRASLAVEESALDRAFDYAHDAVSKYWSDGPFELTVHVGCASARRA